MQSNTKRSVQMSIYRGLYFSTLAGALGGLLASLCTVLLAIPMADKPLVWLPDTIALLCFGSIVGILIYTHFDRVLLGKVRASSIGFGLLFGGLSAIAASALAYGLRAGIALTSPTLYRVTVWAFCFSLIGLGLGLRWVNSNRGRVLHTYVGSLAGGILGGLVFVLFTPHLSAGISMCGLMLAGAGTGFGSGIAPVLVREGVIRFISSGDARAQNKLGKNKTLWDLDTDESYVIGSAPTAQDNNRFQQGADVCIPDSAIAPRHAVVFQKSGRYFIARHPDAAGPEGIAKYVLRIKGKTVVTSQELHPADDLLIGRTALRFESRKHGE
jgi:hypothetical protein